MQFFALIYLFILFVAIAFCTYLGPFQYYSSVESFTEACCAVSHVSVKPIISLACSADQQSCHATSTSVESARITILSKIERTTTVFWETDGDSL